MCLNIYNDKCSCKVDSWDWREREGERVCLTGCGECSICAVWKLPLWGGSLKQLLALPLTGCNCRRLSIERWRAVVIAVFVLCALMENVFYKAQGSRLLGSKELLHKVILPLSYLMWCIINLSSQVVFSHLLYFLFGLFGKWVFAMLCYWGREC